MLTSSSERADAIRVSSGCHQAPSGCHQAPSGAHQDPIRSSSGSQQELIRTPSGAHLGSYDCQVSTLYANMLSRRRSVHIALVAWRAFALDVDSAAAISMVPAQTPSLIEWRPSSMPRWAAKAKARSESRLGKRGAVPMQTPEVKTPEALLREKGGGAPLCTWSNGTGSLRRRGSSLRR